MKSLFAKADKFIFVILRYLRLKLLKYSENDKKNMQYFFIITAPVSFICNDRCIIQKCFFLFVLYDGGQFSQNFQKWRYRFLKKKKPLKG